MDGLLAAYFGSDPSQSEAAATSIAEAISRKEASVLQLVLGVRPQLTDTKDEHLRRKAVSLLVQVVSRSGDSLTAQELLTLCGFFIEKLTDWQCAPIAAQGCLDVLHKGRSPPLQLPSETALQLVRNFLAVQVQGTVISERRLLYQLWQLIIEEYGEPAAAADIDLVDHMITVVDSERDPRCLLAAFSCMQALGRLYERPALAGCSHMTAIADEVFDVVVARYFPMLFTPPKDDDVGLTREKLLLGVVQAMASTPCFAPHAIPYLSEKLGSDFKQAKADALVALPVCCQAYGAAVVRPLLTAVWLMLKPELMAPGAIEGLPPDELASKRAAATAATAVLQACCAALGPGELDALVLRDVCVEDLMKYLGISSNDQGGAGGSEPWWAGPAASQELPGRARGRLACIAAILGAVAASGPASCGAVCEVVLLPLVHSLSRSTQDEQRTQPQQPGLDSCSSSSSGSWCGRPAEALSAAYAVLCAVCGAVGDADWAGGAGAPVEQLQQLLQGLVPVLLNVQHQLAQLLQQSPIPPVVQAQLCVWHVRLWAHLFRCPPTLHLLLQHHQGDAAAAVEWVTPLAVSGDAAEVALVLSWREPSSIRQEAVMVLQMLGRAGQAGCQLLSQAVQPLLRRLLQEQQGQQHQQQVLGLLGQVASSSSAAGGQVLEWLQPLFTPVLMTGQKELLLGMYQCQNHHCLPVLGDIWGPQHSQAGLATVSSQLTAWSSWCASTTGNSSSSSSSAAGYGWDEQQQLVEACIPAAAEGVARLVAACAVSEQMQLALDAFEWVCHAHDISSTVTEGTDIQQQQQWLATAVQGSLGAAVVLALRPVLLQGDSCSRVLDALVGISCTTSTGAFTSTLAGTAAAALAAKWYSAGAVPASTGADVVSSCKDKIRQQLQTLLVPAMAEVAAHAAGGECDRGSGTRLARQLVTVSWLSRALAMQRDDAWLQGLELAISCLRAAHGTGQAPAAPAAQAWPPQPAAAAAADILSSPQVMGAAAGFFSVLVDDAAGVGGLQLGPALHVPCRPLWQQKAFVLAQRQLAEEVSRLQATLSSITAAAAAAGGGGTSIGNMGNWWQSHSLPLFLGGAALLSGVPTKVFATAAVEATPMLLDSLQAGAQQLCGTSVGSSSSSSSSSSGAPAAAKTSAQPSSRNTSVAPRPLLLQLVHGCMMKLTQILLEPAMRVLLEPLVSQLVGTLVQLALLEEEPASAAPLGAHADAAGVGSSGGGRQQPPASAEVREMALLNLTAVMELPYHLLHPHRQAVIKAVTAALDDNKRAVRKAAVRCRRLWSSY